MPVALQSYEKVTVSMIIHISDHTRRKSWGSSESMFHNFEVFDYKEQFDFDLQSTILARMLRFTKIAKTQITLI